MSHLTDKTIFIIRHGQTDFNLKKIVQGSGVNSDLNDTGRAQGKAFYDFYKHEDFDLLIHSKLKRTQLTIDTVIDSGIKTIEDERINEMNWGIHEGKPSSEAMKKDYADLMEQWGKGNYNIGLEAGETAAALGDRLSRFVEDLREMTANRILVCTHGRAMRCLIAVIKGWPLSRMAEHSHSNTGLYKVVQKDGKFEVLLENDTRHLDEQAKA